jgi:hypothetical protein
MTNSVDDDGILFVKNLIEDAIVSFLKLEQTGKVSL